MVFDMAFISLLYKMFKKKKPTVELLGFDLSMYNKIYGTEIRNEFHPMLSKPVKLPYAGKVNGFCDDRNDFGYEVFSTSKNRDYVLLLDGHTGYYVGKRIDVVMYIAGISLSKGDQNAD